MCVCVCMCTGREKRLALKGAVVECSIRKPEIISLNQSTCYMGVCMYACVCVCVCIEDHSSTECRSSISVQHSSITV